MVGKRWEGKQMRRLQDEINEADKEQDRLAEEVVKHNSNSKHWQELITKYLAMGDKIYTLKRKLELYKRTGRENGFQEGLEDISFGDDSSTEK